jgi:hypothetical protein
MFACGGDDAGSPDGSVADAAPADAAPVLDRTRLSAMGLYADLATKQVASDAVEFAPTYALWADGAVKRRWIVLPPGAVIDTADMDRWRVPVGTRLFKEFMVDGRRVETRLIERTGPEPSDFDFAAYVWDADEGEAVRTPEGAEDAGGTAHDVPSEVQCGFCHRGEPGRVLGFSAVQLDHEAEPSVASLARDGRLSDPPAPGTALGPPGPPAVAAALGYLHANCGQCHSRFGGARPDTDMNLRLEVGDRSPEATTIARSTIGVALDNFQDPAYSLRIDPGSPATSGLLHRMSIRGTRSQMPPIASEATDDEAIAVIAAWIESLSPPPPP